MNEHRDSTAIVIGAGIGGLATAVRLAHAGFRVTVLEQHAEPGGRAGVWRSEGFTFDTGPSMVMMREYWDEEAANKHHNVIWDLPEPAIYREFVLVLDRVIERLHKP